MMAKPIWNYPRAAGDITTPNLKLYYRAIIIKTAWYWHQNGHNQMKTQTLVHIPEDTCFFMKKSEMHYGKRKHQQMLSACRRMQITIFITLHKIQVQKIKDLNIKPDTLYLIEEEMGNSLELTGIGKNFLNNSKKSLRL